MTEQHKIQELIHHVAASAPAREDPKAGIVIAILYLAEQVAILNDRTEASFAARVKAAIAKEMDRQMRAKP